MGIVLFDWETSCTTKKVVKPLFIMSYLFDGYLTEPTSYPHFPQLGYLIKSFLNRIKINLIDTFSNYYSIESNLTKLTFVKQVGLGKMLQLSGKKIEEIINELNEELAA